MTSYYDSKAKPREVFGKGPLLDAFYETVNTLTPDTWALKQFISSLWSPEAKTYSWVMPDNFHAHCKVMSTIFEPFEFRGEDMSMARKIHGPTDAGRSLPANVTHATDAWVVREMTYMAFLSEAQLLRIHAMLVGKLDEPQDRKADQMVRKLVRHYYETGILSARVLWYLNTHNIHRVPGRPLRSLLANMPDKSFRFLQIFDCFRVHPNHGNRIRKLYNYVLSRIYEGTLINKICSDIAGAPMDIHEELGDPDIVSEIIQADYAIC